MPTNRRPLKRRRVSLQGQARAWSVMFEAGFDYFDDLSPLGLNEAAAKLEAEDAWHRLGALHLEQRDPAKRGGALPWAIAQFGDPMAKR